MEKKKQERNKPAIVDKVKNKNGVNVEHNLVYTELPGKDVRTIQNQGDGISVMTDADNDAAQKEESGKRTRAIKHTTETW